MILCFSKSVLHIYLPFSVPGSQHSGVHHPSPSLSGFRLGSTYRNHGQEEGKRLLGPPLSLRGCHFSSDGSPLPEPRSLVNHLNLEKKKKKSGYADLPRFYLKSKILEKRGENEPSLLRPQNPLSVPVCPDLHSGHGSHQGWVGTSSIAFQYMP